MKNITYILIFIFSIIFSISAQNNSIESIDDVIKELKNRYAPDGRVAIFNLTVSEVNDKILLSGETNIKEAKDDLIRYFEEREMAFEDNAELLPGKNLGDNIFGIVNLSVANLRGKPNHPAELATQALLGTPVKVYKKKSGFYLIQTPDNYIAWVDDDGITLMDESQLKEWIKSEKILYTNDFGFSYSEADSKSQRVSDLVIGDILVKEGVENNYFKVKYPDGRIAFIEKDFCVEFNNWMDNTYPTEENIISTAKSFMGIPYLWGGTSAKGMDCSGFTKTVFYLNGVVMSRDASQQVNTGILVDTNNGFDNLKPGDLLFFGSRKTEKRNERITHVGIYIGNYEYIHAAGEVKINSLDVNANNFNKYRLNHFIRAKRIINSVDANGVTSIKNNKFYAGDFE